jgi:hypothetical protein
MAYSCPVCERQFERLYMVHSASMEPFTADPRDLMAALEAYSSYGNEKLVICQQGAWLHFSFADTGEERLVQMRKVDEAALEAQREAHAAEVRQCGHEGCDQRGEPYYHHALDVEVGEWRCGAHAYDAGFCQGCGAFCAGMESFDMSRSGLCYECEQELDAALSGVDQDDEWDEGFGY